MRLKLIINPPSPSFTKEGRIKSSPRTVIGGPCPIDACGYKFFSSGFPLNDRGNDTQMSSPNALIGDPKSRNMDSLLRYKGMTGSGVVSQGGNYMGEL